MFSIICANCTLHIVLSLVFSAFKSQPPLEWFQTGLRMITLHNNKWRCDCNLRNFQGALNSFFSPQCWLVSYILIHFFSAELNFGTISSPENPTHYQSSGNYQFQICLIMVLSNCFSLYIHFLFRFDPKTCCGRKGNFQVFGICATAHFDSGIPSARKG